MKTIENKLDQLLAASVGHMDILCQYIEDEMGNNECMPARYELFGSSHLLPDSIRVLLKDNHNSLVLAALIREWAEMKKGMVKA